MLLTIMNEKDTTSQIPRTIPNDELFNDADISPFTLSLSTWLYPRIQPYIEIESSSHVFTVVDLHQWIMMICNTAELHAGCPIPAAFYTIRYVTNTNKVCLFKENWRYIITVALLIASKMWDDTPVENIGMARILCRNSNVYGKEYSSMLRRVNTWEINFLKTIDYKTVVVSSDFEQCYDSLCHSNTLEDSPPLTTSTDIMNKITSMCDKVIHDWLR